MKEYMNYLAHFYEEGSYAEDLPPKKRVYTESEMQRAISKALMYHGIYNHLRREDEDEQQKKVDKEGK